MHPNSFDPRRRLAVVVAVFFLLGAGLTAQLVRLQVLDRDRYVSWGEDQRFTTTPLLGERGELRDRNGEELAISLPAPVVYADPLLVADPEAEAAKLAPLLGREVADIEALLDMDGRFVYLARPTTEAVATEVRALDLDGVFIAREPERFHPNGADLARGLLGLVGVDNIGLSGLETQYDEILTGTPGRVVSERGVGGRSIPDGQLDNQPAINGVDITLTLDRALQFQTERTLAKHVLSSGAKGGTAIITNPGTGEILAMASVVLDEDGKVETTSDNRALTWTYEPASVMKAVTFAGVLDRGVATPATERVVSSQLELYDETFTDNAIYDPKVMTVEEILVRSSNTGTIAWAQELGADALYDNLRKFGFGSETGLGFPGESPGILQEVAEWSGTSIATVAIGQGIAVTPMQMLLAYNTIANGGVYVAPKLVQDLGGEPVDDAGAISRRVIAQGTADELTDILSLVVEAGTAKRAQVPGYSVAAKTGTARKVQETGGYRDSAGNFTYIATVAGFFPADDPELSMIVVVDEPTNGFFASTVAAPLFAELAAWSLRHYQISPNGDVLFGDAETNEAALGGSGDKADHD